MAVYEGKHSKHIKHIGTATTVNGLLILLSTGQIPLDATINVLPSYHTSNVEVRYDEDTNTVLLK